jgi:hypothetical protein
LFCPCRVSTTIITSFLLAHRDESLDSHRSSSGSLYPSGSSDVSGSAVHFIILFDMFFS